MKNSTLLIKATTKESLATVGGFVAVLLWSASIALARSLSEQLGPFTTGAVVYGVGALAAIAHVCISRQMGRLVALSRRYIVGCGLLFVLYTLMLYGAIGLAENREQVLAVGLLNYLWPALTLLISPALLGHRATWRLAPGTVLALVGVVLVMTQGSEISWSSLTGNIAEAPIPYSLGFAAAVCWALYSNLARKWGGGQKGGAVSLFIIATAVVMIIGSAFIPGQHALTYHTCVEAGFYGLANYLAYMLWDTAMRRGNMVLVTAGSYLTPLLSTLVTMSYLSIIPAPSIWFGCILLVFGSVLSWRSLDRQASLS